MKFARTRQAYCINFFCISNRISLYFIMLVIYMNVAAVCSAALGVVEGFL